MIHRLLCSVLLAVICLPAFASASASDHWQSIIDPLIGSGITQIGAFNLIEFREKAEKLAVGRLEAPPASVLSGSRSSGFYLCTNKPQANILENLPTEALSSVAQLELHELLGAFCFDDSRYALSMALKMLSLMNASPKRDGLVRSYAKTIFAKPTRLAGGTVVSGGGDLVSVYVKDRVLQAIMGDNQNRLAATDDFLVKYASIDFEPLPNSAKRVVVLHYVYRLKGGENFAIFIPMERWKQGDAARQALIEETARKITEVFPSNGSQSVRTFHPSDCGANGPSITFPATNDGDVRYIQDIRGGFLLGCSHYGSGFQGMDVTAPSTGLYEDPKQSGSFYFSCAFTYNGVSTPNRFETRAGQGYTSSITYDAPGVSYLSLNVSISASGELQSTQIYMKTNSGQRIMTPPVKGMSQSTIDGVPITFSCQKDR